MRKITDVYEHYGIPYHLQIHMLRVAGIADLILSNWQGPQIDRHSLLRVLLLHDIGNIVKIHEDEIKNENAKKFHKECIQKHGTNDHKISKAIGKELGLTEDELKLMDGKIFIKNDETVKSNDYTRKIGAYADQRAAPEGVKPIIVRLREAQKRYKDKPGSSMNNPRTKFLIQRAVELEKQVMKYCALKPEDITDQSVEPFINGLREFMI